MNYSDRARALQARFGAERLADAVAGLAHPRLTEGDRAVLARADLFFLATVDGQGRPTCSYKGGDPGFVRVLDARTLAFPSYDGNGMYRSLGNVLANPQVGLLFIDFESPRRLRVNGRASVAEDDPLRAQFVGAQLVVRVTAAAIFPNCPRYLHRMEMVERSPYAPCEGQVPPVPNWKKRPEFNAVLPPDDPAREP